MIRNNIHTDWAQEELQMLNIIIVDDDEKTANLIQRVAGKLGHNAVVAKCCKVALHKIEEENFDLILLDINLPDSNEIDLIQEIRETTAAINIVPMVSEPDRETEERIRGQRITYYLIKPFEIDELKSIINHLSKRKFKLCSSSRLSPDPVVPVFIDGNQTEDDFRNVY